MGTKQIRVSERLYARIESEKREGETMGEALERMVGGYDLLDFTADADGRESLDVDRIDAEMVAASNRNAEEIRDDLGL